MEYPERHLLGGVLLFNLTADPGMCFVIKILHFKVTLVKKPSGEYEDLSDKFPWLVDRLRLKLAGYERKYSN